ncbi:MULTISPECIES: DUF3825 domain-containing protein [Paenibacillus]|uniref:DUF3825 domain-containing protein n=1 Tax=Paenibacillus TaxID=44249 RepID=UPI0009FA7682
MSFTSNNDQPGYRRVHNCTAKPKRDFVLAVRKDNNSEYVAKTCLSLEMAYQNARVLAKPDNEWLKPL